MYLQVICVCNNKKKDKQVIGVVTPKNDLKIYS
jgi:hypothetical protein